MTVDEMIQRINELYHKSLNDGLNEEELAEQQRLRKEYVNNIRNNLKSQLDNIEIVEADGTVHPLKKNENR